MGKKTFHTRAGAFLGFFLCTLGATENLGYAKTSACDQHLRAFDERAVQMFLDLQAKYFSEWPTYNLRLANSDPALRLAMLAALEDKAGATPILKPHIKEALLDSSETKRKARKLRFSSASEARHRKRFMATYLALTVDDSWKEGFKKRFSLPSDVRVAEFIEQHFQAELAFHGYKKALGALGLVDYKIHQRLSAEVAKKSNLIRGLTVAALDAALIISKDYSGLFLPKQNLFKNLTLTDDQIARGLNNGFESLMPELVKQHGSRARAQLAYNLTVKAVNYVTLGLLVNDVGEGLIEEWEQQKAKDQENAALAQRIAGTDLTTRYDWAHKEQALEDLWEDKLREHEAAKGIRIDRAEPEWVAKKKKFMDLQLSKE